MVFWQLVQYHIIETEIFIKPFWIFIRGSSIKISLNTLDVIYSTGDKYGEGGIIIIISRWWLS